MRQRSRHPHADRYLWLRILGFAALCLLGAAPSADAQLSKLISPGPLSKAHATLEGAANCQKCHTPGRKVMAEQCLVCHKPIAERITARKGVHRDATGDCIKCHVEHAGADADARPFDLKKFDHARDTGFPLDGRHAAADTECAKCHKTHSFLTLSSTCTSCHKDVHNGTLGPKCQTCHATTSGFKDARTQFDHSKTAYPLVGAHLQVACEKCHANKIFKGVKFAQCTDCHKSPHRQNLGNECRSCHTPDTWKTKKIDHARTGYPLKGKHATVECVQCHAKSPVRQVLAFDKCAKCHQDPHKGAFKQDCASCHSESMFGRAKFDHTKDTRFPLVGKHEPLACAKCHKGTDTGGTTPAKAPAKTSAKTLTKTVDFRGLSTTCVSCHADVHKGQLGPACETCHAAATFKLPKYVHPRFPDFFGGKHTAVPCASCHAPQPLSTPRRTNAPVDTWTLKNVSTACASCHADVHLGQVGTACETCHKIDSAGFAAVTFAHSKSSFALTGRHVNLACSKCHMSETAAFPAGRGTAVRLKGLDTKCATCHTDQHLGQLSKTCDTCHTTATFKLPFYKHAKESAAIITGKHAGLQCAQCHKQQEGQYPARSGATIRYKVGTACLSCHADQHGGTLGKLCETCHSTEAWQTVSRAFHKSTAFPLEGRHVGVECASCHVNGVTKGTPTRCYDCHWLRHQDDRYQTRLGTDCGSCHRPTSWLATNWNHATMTGVEISPAHRALGCDSCHKNAKFTTGNVACFSCHASQFQATTSPNHVAARFPTDCQMCHKISDRGWSQAKFSHAAFPLVGLHAAQPCAACHKNNADMGTTSRTCVNCHKTEYDRTTRPNHAAAGYSTACEQCHSASAAAFTASFNHAAVFPLVGVHATQPCAACHVNNVFHGTPRNCYGCHRADFDRTTSPNHAAAGYSTACESCHSNTSATWTSASFNHATVFPLVGVHATQPCTACHVNNVFHGTPRNCYGCHRADFDRTTSPNHAAAGYSTACETCHSNTSATWTSASFNHNQFFVLAGRHLTAACADCHKNNVFHGTPRTCLPCHQAAYNATTNPNHMAAGFPTTCETCHRNTDTSFTQGTFNHTWFPITTGRHAGNPCAACHIDRTNFMVFSCITGCHAKATTDAKHQGRSGYRYDSAACYSCHPRGNA